ncbi:MAG: hypothetical protein R2708_17085 [Vicinamibacterales bacterium]
MLVGLDSVAAAVLKGVGADLVGKADAAAFLVQVEHHAAALDGDPPERHVGLLAAVAARRVEDVAGDAGGVHAREHVVAVSEVALHQRDMGRAVEPALEHVDGKIAMLRRQLGGRHLFHGRVTTQGG